MRLVGPLNNGASNEHSDHLFGSTRCSIRGDDAAGARTGRLRWLTSTEYIQSTVAEDIANCLDAGMDPNAISGGYATALHAAIALNRDADVFAALLHGRADPNVRDQNGTPVPHMAAAVTSDPEVIAALLDGGANPSFQDRVGGSAPHVAARENENPEVTSSLIDGGATPTRET